ncbi:unnamed protein product [Polarella glacialis]|uniref:Uncharacterized protein n=1 Tax=Polarella glacialis TaxID=89957 RepID=A0A813GRP5_POLGL|nr:unnamed protein product [Polarella glacialis]
MAAMARPWLFSRLWCAPSSEPWRRLRGPQVFGSPMARSRAALACASELSPPCAFREWEDESQLGALPVRARLRARGTRFRKPPPLRGIPLTPNLPRPPDPEMNRDWWVDRRSLPLAPQPPGLKGDPKQAPPEKYIDIRGGR